MFKKLFKLPIYDGPTEPADKTLTIAKIRKYLAYYDNPRLLRKFTAAVLTDKGNYAIGTPTLIKVNGDRIDVYFESANCRREGRVDAYIVLNELGECVVRKNLGIMCRKTDQFNFHYHITPEPTYG